MDFSKEFDSQKALPPVWHESRCTSDCNKPRSKVQSSDSGKGKGRRSRSCYPSSDRGCSRKGKNKNNKTKKHHSPMLFSSSSISSDYSSDHLGVAEVGVSSIGHPSNRHQSLSPRHSPGQGCPRAQCFCLQPYGGRGCPERD